MSQADQQQQTESDDITQAQGHEDQQQSADEQQTQQDAQPDGQQEDDKPKLTPEEKERARQQRRFDRMTRDKYQAQAEIQRLQAELARFQGGADDPQTNAQPPSHADLQQQAQQVLEAERFSARCDDVADAGEAEYPDFQEKVIELGHELPLFDQRGQPTPIVHAIMDAENPAAVLYYLGSNPDEAADLAELTPRQQLRRLVQIEQQIGTQTATPPTPAKPARTVSKAPAPTQPNRSASGQFTAADSAKQSDAEWYATRIKRH